ncbi:cytochrome c oxidase assembly protein [Sphingobium sp. HWE2-09]|uniref:cytochrome c oxidase assembly protein n=1 Tax=Sphingobium sp. HWE2-09 TaxID=3108390 RepID=UPI002DC36094|nr:cytochrome c oxidase assembly protein [Sphingobium sp. HWE2-09]
MTSYCGPPPLPDAAMAAWNFDPILLVGLTISALFALRSASPRLALAGVAVLAVAFVSPLCAISAALFMARAVHHILIVAIAAPLFALAFPSRRTAMIGPAFVAATGLLWAWHIPSLYDAALADARIYWLMQASLLGSAIWFWRSLFAAPVMPAALGAIAAMAQMGMLGALLTFAPAPLYAAHAGKTMAWGLPQLVDQQLAGLIMWVPGIIPYAIALALIARRGWARAAVTA